MSPRGKHRRVVEVLDKRREDRAYLFRVRFECGHTGRISARVSATHVPAGGWCQHPECINPQEAA